MVRMNNKDCDFADSILRLEKSWKFAWYVKLDRWQQAFGTDMMLIINSDEYEDSQHKPQILSLADKNYTVYSGCGNWKYNKINKTRRKIYL